MLLSCSHGEHTRHWSLQIRLLSTDRFMQRSPAHAHAGDSPGPSAGAEQCPWWPELGPELAGRRLGSLPRRGQRQGQRGRVSAPLASCRVWLQTRSINPTQSGVVICTWVSDQPSDTAAARMGILAGGRPAWKPLRDNPVLLGPHREYTKSLQTK